MKRLNYILKSKYILLSLAIIILIICIVITKYYPFKSKYSIDDNIFVGIVKDYKLIDNKLTINLKAKEEIIVNYKLNKENINLSYGDKIIVKGKLKVPDKNTIFNNFNYKKYLYNKKIYYLVNANYIEKKQNNKNYLYTIKNIIYKRVNNLKSSKYIKTLLFGDNKLDKEVKDSYRTNGISHLFSVSGFHISFLLSIIYFYLDKVTYNKKTKYIVTSLFLIFYMLLCSSFSLLRSGIMYLIISVSFIFKLDINKNNILYLTLIICLIINPFIIYDIGFIYSYTISFFLITFCKKIKTKNKLLMSFYITVISFIVSFPITTYISHEVNFLSIIINILIVPIISVLLLPFTFITLIFPIFDNILYGLTNILENISLFISKIDIFKIVFCKPNIIFIMLYYIVIIFTLIKKKYYYLILIMFIVHKLVPIFNMNNKIVFFDVGQGDSIFINYANNRSNILIDIGTGYDIDNIILYLKSYGISKLDYLIVTHGDSDHIGGMVDFVNKYRVDKVIFNCGEFNNLENELIKVLNNRNIKYYSCIKALNIDKNKLYFLNNKDYGNENDNSIVLYTKLNNYKFLFMGDASVKTEKDILDNYNLNDIDVIKVGHHGSKTSSSGKFIDYVRPRYSVISVGKNNNYGHPNKEVIDNLNKSKIYRTDQDGSIMFKIENNKLDVDTCLP